MQEELQAALDTLNSSRSSLEQCGGGLRTVEGILAQTLLCNDDRQKKDEIARFICVQEHFSTNVPSRMLPWLTLQSDAMKRVTESTYKRTVAEEDEFRAISSQVVRALSILQGVILLHNESKGFMGRLFAIEIILDLLSVFRQTGHKPFANTTNGANTRSNHIDPSHPSLPSAVLDTLLCILVDAPLAMRVFEDANGVEIVVKLLKRASNPKDVRMKCIEFLYFYLMDETGASKQVSTQPSSPTKPSYQQISQSQPSASSSASSSSGGSGFSSFPSWSPTPTLNSITPPQSPTKPSKPKTSHGPLGMLRKEVDFVPLSPKKSQISKLGLGKRNGLGVKPLRFATRARNPSPLSRASSEDSVFVEDEPPDSEDASKIEHPFVRSTEDKKRILGQLLGNVDALVEGVKSAGIWGLGE